MKDNFLEKFKNVFPSQIAIKAVEESQAQVKTIRPSAKWLMLILP